MKQSHKNAIYIYLRNLLILFQIVFILIIEYALLKFELYSFFVLFTVFAVVYPAYYFGKTLQIVSVASYSAVFLYATVNYKGLFRTGSAVENAAYSILFSIIIGLIYLTFKNYKKGKIYKTSLLLLAGGVFFTAAIENIASKTILQREQKKFEDLVNDSEVRMEFRISQYEELLKLLTSFVSYKQNVDIDEWSYFSNKTLKEIKNVPALNSVGYFDVDKLNLRIENLKMFTREGEAPLCDDFEVKNNLDLAFQNIKNNHIESYFVPILSYSKAMGGSFFLFLNRSNNYTLKKARYVFSLARFKDFFDGVSSRVSSELAFRIFRPSFDISTLGSVGDAIYQSKTSQCKNKTLSKKSTIFIGSLPLSIVWHNSNQFSTAHDGIRAWILFTGLLLTLILTSLVQSLKSISSKASELAKERTHSLNTLVSSIDDAILEVDSYDRIANSWITNSELINFSGKVIDGEKLSDVLDAQLVEKIKSYLSLVRKDNSPRHFEYQINSKENLWTSVKIAPLSSDVTAVGRSSISFRDITAKKNSEMALLSTSKFAALGEMAGGVAHEINNPLTIIHGLISRLDNYTNQVQDKEKYLELIKKMQFTVDRITKIVKGLKTFSRNGELDKPEFTSLSLIFSDVMNLSEEKIRKSNITLIISPFLKTKILCRSVQIAQVIINLINNAADAISHLEDKWIEIKFEEVSNKSIRIIITDSGNGIPLDIREKIMQPFFTTKEVGKGTGLGLSISRGIIESHHGRLYIDEEAVNTTFVIELPINYQEQKAVA